ncbi:hypothetical protein MMC12_005677 [Toensbergia leucococca]|nr:hypothetical protein [Toensbergia leucococca]
MPWGVKWHIDHQSKVVTLKPGAEDLSKQNEIMAETLENARAKGIFEVLKGWRNELYPIYGSEFMDVGLERAASALFGVVTFGVHLTAYVEEPGGLKIWVPRRAKDKQTYGGFLDNTVAGGISLGEKPFECLVREAAEEASFSEEMVRRSAKAVGIVSYFYVRDARAGGETGLLQPEVQYVYDLEVDIEVVPKPGDNEVEQFYLWTIKEVMLALAEGQFKPNCAVVLLDFFVRHGILTAENEKYYIDIVARIHRALPFPTTSRLKG